MRNMLNVMQYAHDSLNSATNHGKLLKRRFLFNVHAHLFDIDSLLGHRILLTMIGNDLQQKLQVSFVFDEHLVIFLCQCPPYSCVINNFQGAETTFCSSTAFLFFPHVRICGQKFIGQTKEAEQVLGVAGDKVIQSA